MRLKHQLSFYLKHTGLNASQLARKAGVPKQSLSDWLAGASPRKIEHLKKVADALETTIDHLCFGGGKEIPPLFDPVTSNDKDRSEVKWMEGIFEVRLRRIRK